MLSILLGCLGYSLLNISQAVQKIGLARVREQRFLGIGLWVTATIGTLVSSLLVFAAVTLGNASLVGAMAATGLAALAVFSHFVMKERVGLKEIMGVASIILAAGLMGFFAIGSAPSLIRLDILFIMLFIVISISCVLWLIFRGKTGPAGIIIGVFSGSLGGFVPLFQKVATSQLGKSMSLFFTSSKDDKSRWGQILSMFSNPFAVTWILLSLVSMIVLQFAYKKAEAIRIIPFFTSSCIVVPVIGGVLCLEEKLHPVQWIGLAVMFGGLLLLTIKGRKAGFN